MPRYFLALKKKSEAYKYESGKKEQLCCWNPLLAIPFLTVSFSDGDFVLVLTIIISVSVFHI